MGQNVALGRVSKAAIVYDVTETVRYHTELMKWQNGTLAAMKSYTLTDSCLLL